MKLCALYATILYYSHFSLWVKTDAPHHSSAGPLTKPDPIRSDQIQSDPDFVNGRG